MNNRYGIDVSYFKKELTSLSESLPDRTKEELYNYLTTLANIVKPPTLVQQQLCGSAIATPKLPRFDDVMKHKKFTHGMNWVEQANEIYETIKKLGNFA
jgi:hypothetical protein